MNIKTLKAELKKLTDKHPKKYYAVEALKSLNFVRKHCKCGMYFWTQTEESLCGDCEGYTFIGKKIGKKLSYTEVAKAFYNFMKKRGYTPTARYPIVARWRSDIDFVHAAINNYQPYVVSGEVQPPANPLTVIQPSLRFNDTDNVGLTGRHFVLHGHVEQFTIQPYAKFDQNKYFLDMHAWLTQGLCIPEKMIKYHEDAWGGGGNLGTAMEHFVGGLELGNQVYMNYEIKPNGTYVKLKDRVLDMGAGQERYTWIVSGEADGYKVIMPDVCKKLYKITGVKPDKELMSKFMPKAGILNLDEVDNIDAAWRKISKDIKIPVKQLKEKIEPLAALYSVADHSRALLFALADGALPSNVGGGYNLRVIYRRAYDFIQKYGWRISIPEVCEWHANELKPQYPELARALPEVKEILNIEEQKYKKTKQKASLLIAKLKGKKLKENELLSIYDSFGITPELLKEHKIIASVPSDFYSKIAERHEQKEQAAATKKVIKYSLNVPETKKLYYQKPLTFKARVLKSFDNKVVLDRTAFYPTSGGQLHDIGTLNNRKVVDVIKQGNHIIHILDGKLASKEVIGTVDSNRRKRLKQHHTATHIIAGAARSVLGSHVWQAGSKVTPDYARLDITHYSNLSQSQIEKIELAANKAIEKSLKVDKTTLPKHKAERLYGFRLYQGGAIPGPELRILKIKGIGFEDVEACAGTHCDNTKEVGKVKIVGVKRVQDGVVRLEYKAGKQAEEASYGEVKLIEDILVSLRGNKSLASALVSELDLAAKSLNTTPEYLPKTVKRFIANLDEWNFNTDKYLKELNAELASSKDLKLVIANLFRVWKKQRKARKK